MSEDRRMKLKTRQLLVGPEEKGMINVESVGTGLTGCATIILYIKKDGQIWDNLGLECVWQYGRD